MSNFTEEQLEVVKHVMFGLQRQANVINDAVVKIIARGIVNFNGDDSCLASENIFADTVVSFLNKAVADNNVSDETLLMLIAGEQSLACLKAEGPKMVTSDYISDDSPKRNFRITMLGSASVDNSYDVDIKKPEGPVLQAYDGHELTYREQAEKLKDDILPIVPEAMRAEISDNDYMLALCAAPYYFSI